ncbi:SMI1/KNR4 family protein [Nocardioides sp.]|uniref:SMI1/KNR4 family protein n=1 Tax=Nocardioides sp. TaxID=35761 RepID=UPI002B9286B4|nr:SMI1/KNR4 family protein [Nocardioides sp.]HXH78507.1 SMI1/KNR4 family protein [Nocardioides sp.]
MDADPTIFGGPALEGPPGDGLIRSIEEELDVRLPAAYVALSRIHNGGYLARNGYPSPSPTTWADDHVGVTFIAAIGRTARFSLCGETGSAFWVHEWGYPDVGVYFADCPSAGHDMIALDYRVPGEPSVVHVDQEASYRITPIAPDFVTFVNGLVSVDEFAW